MKYLGKFEVLARALSLLSWALYLESCAFMSYLYTQNDL